MWINHWRILRSDYPCRSSLSAISNSNKYESGEKINAAAQRTLLVDSGSETDSKVYERHAAVRGGVKAGNRSRRGKQNHWKNKPAERRTIDNGRKEVWLAARARKRDQRLHGKWINKLVKTSGVRWNRNQYFTISIQNTLQWRRNGYSVPCSGPVRSRILRKTAERVRKRSHVG